MENWLHFMVYINKPQSVILTQVSPCSPNSFNVFNVTELGGNGKKLSNMCTGQRTLSLAGWGQK